VRIVDGNAGVLSANAVISSVMRNIVSWHYAFEEEIMARCSIYIIN